MEIIKLMSSKHRAILFLFAGLVIQGVNGQEEEKYLSVDLSSEKLFFFEKIEESKPDAIPNKYKVEQNERLLQVIEVKTSEKLYEITAPLAEDIDPKLDRGFEGFKGASVIRTGDLILNYYGTRKVYYSRTSESFILLPSYLKKNGVQYSANGWEPISAELLISSCLDRDSAEDEPDQYVVYELSSGKVYEVRVPEGFVEHRFLADRLDQSQGIIELKAYEFDGDPRDDVDLIIKKSLGWYKVRQKPKEPAESAP